MCPRNLLIYLRPLRSSGGGSLFLISLIDRMSLLSLLVSFNHCSSGVMIIKLRKEVFHTTSASSDGACHHPCVFFHDLKRVIKEQHNYKMQREKLYNLHSKAYCDCFQNELKFCATNFRTIIIWSLEILFISKTKTATIKRVV